MISQIGASCQIREWEPATENKESEVLGTLLDRGWWVYGTVQSTPVADPSGIYYIPDSKPRCGCHHDDQYADGTYGGCLEGVV